MVENPYKRGATTAAGVPKPAAPSKKAPIRKPINTNWTLLSVETYAIEWDIPSMPPLFFIVANITKAPKTINKISIESIPPQ